MAREKPCTDLKDTRRFAEGKSGEAEKGEEVPASEKAESAAAEAAAAPEGGGHDAEGKALSNRRKMRKLLLLHVATVQTKG